MRLKEDHVGMAVALALTLLSGPAWFYGLYHAAAHQMWFLFTLDFVFPPVGVVHGFGVALGVW